MKILVNDGIEPIGKQLLEAACFEVDMNKIDQSDLINKLPEYDAICVRSATKVRKELIDACPNLKAIGRGGVGLDNIDVEYAKSKGIAVINTPAASSRSVGELAMAHMLGLSRFLHLANRQMPETGNTQFNELKKAYSKGAELEGKTLGIIGLGRIGMETARCGLGMGMNIVAYDPFVSEVTLHVGPRALEFQTTIQTESLDKLLATADYISLHIPSVGKAILSKEEFEKMKTGVFVINCSRGGTIDEDALIHALNSGKVAAAGLDVFDNEPTPRMDILSHPRISLTPHIGASTEEAQNKIGEELAQKLIAALNNQ
ncbi:MAG TPA: D-2-hydroxyacid dehydrogenase [Saprospiraceae bacterium]|nr:D-2-hydroxyacid dehydrogenase [Saprospiraceae bacterium]